MRIFVLWSPVSSLDAHTLCSVLCSVNASDRATSTVEAMIYRACPLTVGPESSHPRCQVRCYLLHQLMPHGHDREISHLPGPVG
ncbi:hypothetical protein BDW71DRAFT_188839 [Aspergillus fruticulosus]